MSDKMIFRVAKIMITIFLGIFVFLFVQEILNGRELTALKAGCGLLGFPDGAIIGGQKVCLEYHSFDGVRR